MSKLDHLNLLKFLSKPRFADEVAEHYGIPKKLANFHLREAIKSGLVLVSEKPVLQTLKKSDGEPKRFSGFVYVFRKSPMLANISAKFRVEANNSISKSKRNVFSTKFLSRAPRSLGKRALHVKLSGFSFEKSSNSHTTVHRFRTSMPLVSSFDVPSAKGKLVRSRTVNQLLEHRTTPSQKATGYLSHAERIHLFQALLKEPLTFLDLHSRFGVSKQIIRRLVKKGLLMEIWGPKTVGVRFKLSNKGKIHLRKMEGAAKLEPEMRERVFIRVKHRTSF